MRKVGDSGQVRWSGCAICWFGLALLVLEVLGSAPRDLWQLDSAFRKPTQLYPSERAKSEAMGARERKKGPSDVIETEALGECVTNGPRRLDPQNRIRFLALYVEHNIRRASNYFV